MTMNLKWLPTIGGAVMVVAGIARQDMTTIALGGGLIGIPGLTSHPQVIVLKNGNGHAKPE